MFLGEDFLAWMLLALGAAMAVGNLAALILPHPDNVKDAKKAASRASIIRCLAFILLGVVAAVWASVSILAT